MCLAIPGQITEVWSEGGALFASADFAGETRRVCLNFLPDLDVGDYVIVHAGFALSKVGQEQVDEVMAAMREAGLIDEHGRDVHAAEFDSLRTADAGDHRVSA